MARSVGHSKRTWGEDRSNREEDHLQKLACIYTQTRYYIFSCSLTLCTVDVWVWHWWRRICYFGGLIHWVPLVHSICLSLGHLFCNGMQFLSAYREQLSGKQKHNQNNIVHMEDWNTSTASTRLLKKVCKDSLAWMSINKIKSFTSARFFSDMQRKVQVFFPWSSIVLSLWII